MEKKITAILKDLGMPMGNLGFKYIKDGTLAAVEDESIMYGITKGGLYIVVAKKNGTTPSRVERAIRHGIETVFATCNKDTLAKYFGDNVGIKLTNRNFIAALVNEIKEG